MKNWNDSSIMKFIIALIIAVFIITAGWDYYVHREEGLSIADDLINISLFLSVMSVLAIYRFVPTSRLGNWAKNEYEILIDKEKKGILTKQEEKSLSHDRFYDVINHKAWSILKISLLGLAIGLSIKAIQFFN